MKLGEGIQKYLDKLLLEREYIPKDKRQSPGVITRVELDFNSASCGCCEYGEGGFVFVNAIVSRNGKGVRYIELRLDEDLKSQGVGKKVKDEGQVTARSSQGA